MIMIITDKSILSKADGYNKWRGFVAAMRKRNPQQLNSFSIPTGFPAFATRIVRAQKSVSVAASRNPASSNAFGHPWVIAWLLIALIAIFPGCDRSQPSAVAPSHLPNESQQSPPVTSLANPVGSLKLAIRGRQWALAWQAAEIILRDAGVKDAGIDKSPDRMQDSSAFESIAPDTLVLIAQAAHQTGRTEQSAQFLRWACRNEAYQNPARVRQTMVAMIGIGQYFAGLQFLEQALVAQPDQHETRRWLFDFYIGADDRIAALRHGHYLIQSRRFDIGLLKDLSNTERRTLDAKPLDQMVTLNPNDKRPLLGSAKTHFDQSKFDEAIATLNEILSNHPDYHPAQALLGQTYSAARRFDELEQWAANQTDGIEDYPGYWIALGDWSRSKQDRRSALRAFAQAATCPDPDVVQIWTRLATLLTESAESESLATENLIAAVNDHAQQLTQFHLMKDRFTRTGEISRSIALDVAGILVKLGRLWEAEAWSAIATTLPEDDSIDVATFRNGLVNRLHPQLPWRNPESLPDLQPLLDGLALPAIEQVVSAGITRGESDLPRIAAAESGDPASAALKWKMDDEAERRGLAFWGRTDDSLNEPGIMLYQTLGCGGGTLDFDLDGWSDLYLVNAGGMPPEQDSQPNELFRNFEGQFLAVGHKSASDDRGFGQGVAVGDVNEDGFPDLLVLNYGPNRLLLNNGDGSFRDASARLPPGNYDEWSASGAIADVDHDGLADIVVVNYCETLGPVTQLCPMTDSKLIRSCSPMLFPAAPDRFYKSSGDGGFEEVTETWNAVTDSPGRGLGIVVGDLDGKPGNEVLVANDMTNNHYWSSISGKDSESSFKLAESAMLRGLGGDDRGIPQGSMGIASADFDRDGDMDFYVTNFDKEYNTLHMQSSAGIWQDRTGPLGLSAPTRPLVAFGTEAIDLDNSGELALVLTNGHVDLFSRGEERAMYQQPMQIFRRATSGVYENVSVSSLGPYFASNHVGRALWTIDADRNGRMDFVVTHQTEPTALLINNTADTGNWLRLDLRGTQSSRGAVGSTVRVETSMGIHTAFQVAGDGYLCSNDRILHIGLGDITDTTVDLQVTWPTGTQETFTAIPTRDQTVIVESQTTISD